MHDDPNSPVQGSNTNPFSGATSVSHRLASQKVKLPDHVTEGRHVRIWEPMRLKPVSHEKLQLPPVVCLEHAIVPFSGATSMGHWRAEWQDNTILSTNVANKQQLGFTFTTEVVF